MALLKAVHLHERRGYKFDNVDRMGKGGVGVNLSKKCYCPFKTSNDAVGQYRKLL
jgi:hypothetical protein